MTVDSILLAYFLLYLGVAFALPTCRVRQRSGVNPVTFGRGDTPHDFIGRLFKTVVGAAFAGITFQTFLPDYAARVLPVLPWLDFPAARIAGAALLAASLAWTVAAQIQMGNSWRIGIDEENASELVDKGVFAISRNPVFLGMIATLGGYFLVRPNALTLLIFIVGLILMQIQVRLEEEFLERKHGARYADFRKRVRRWL